MGKNEELGLPHGEGMEKIAFCFDIDGTLINEHGLPNMETLVLASSLLCQKWKNVDVIFWSGGGADYAEHHAKRMLPVLAIYPKVKFYSKTDHKILREKYAKLIAIDDIQDTRIGDANLIVRNK